MSSVTLQHIEGAPDRLVEPGAAPTSSPYSLLVDSVRLEETADNFDVYSARFNSDCSPIQVSLLAKDLKTPETSGHISLSGNLLSCHSI